MWKISQNNLPEENEVSVAIPGDDITSAPVAEQTVVSYIDGYCERNHEPGPFSEPLNLLTNLAFIIGSILVFRLLKSYGQLTRKNADIIFLSSIMFLIGLGSGTFHSLPSGSTVLMDVIPITIFIHVYLVVFFKRVVGLNLHMSFIILGLFIAIGYIFQITFSPDTLNGTIMYVPTYLMLIVMVLILCFVKQNPFYSHLINSAVIWTFSLAFRTIDMQVCYYTHNIGTHFMWHILNGIVLYRLTVLLIMDKISKERSLVQAQ